MSILRAIWIAVKAHKGQRDKGGKPYIFHPIHVAMAVKGRNEKIVALLHDVLEDSDFKIGKMDFLSQEQKEALLLLTNEGSYFDYIDKVKKNSIAREVKLKDLEHNMNVRRLKKVQAEDIKRLEKYRKAYEILSYKTWEVQK